MGGEILPFKTYTMNKIRKPRKGIVEKYFNFLVILRGKIMKDPAYQVRNLIDKHRVGTEILKPLVQLKIISGTGTGGRQWIGRFPDYDMIQEIRLQIRNNKKSNSNTKKIKPFKPTDLFHPISGKQMGVGNFHHLPNKEKSKLWVLIKSITIFKYKLKIYKIK
tara:strand:- start:538 stop:1026 length:489 start_codon:yes stop_codon:yes gene_type:complete